MYSLMKPPIIMNVHNVRVRKLCLFLTFSLSSTTGGGCFSGGFSISVLRATSVSFSDDAGALGLLAGTGGFTSAGAGAETWWTGGEGATGSTGGACGVEPFVLGAE